MAEGRIRKRKRLSKNKKRSWKFTDIQDVEEYLDDHRRQERTGGLVAEKADDQLYFIDKKVEDEAADKVPSKRRRKEPKPLRCHANLEPDPNIKPVKVKRNVKTKVRKKPGVTKERQFLKEALAVKQRIESQKALQAKIRAATALPSFTQDLWSDEGKSADQNDIIDHHLTVTKKKPVKAPKTYHRKTSELPAVEVAHPGASYNPAFDDHQELLSKAYTAEVKKHKAEQKVTRALDDMFPSEAPGEKTFLSEMSAGLTGSDSEDEGTTSSAEQDVDRISVNPPVRREDKKSITQRKKEKQRREKELKILQEKEKKLKENEIFRLKQIKKDIKEIEKDQEEKAKKKTAEKDLEKVRTKKLGYLKYEEPDVEIKLSDELEGSLRRLKPEGQLISDRFKSLQKRNIIEPRKRTKIVKKYKRKVFEKKSHKAIVC